MRAAKVQASLRIRAVSPEPSLLAHTSSESRGTFRQKARSLAPLNGWACAVKICHDGMLEDTNSLDGARLETRLFSRLLQAIGTLLIALLLVTGGTGEGPTKEDVLAAIMEAREVNTARRLGKVHFRARRQSEGMCICI